MKTSSRIFAIAVATAVLSWFLPWLYSFLVPVNVSEPFVAYSPIAGKMILTMRQGHGEAPVIYDLDGNTFTADERDSLLPQQFFPQLMSKGTMPDTILGREVTMPMLRRSQVVFVHYPSDINCPAPGVNLIMESIPPRLEFENPKEVFRITDDGIEFITMATNSVNTDRSRRFTDAMTKAGFHFPATDLNANVTTRKSYDEGYLMIDAEGDIFHVKQQAGRPYVAKVPRPTPDFKASKVFIMENFDRDRLGFVIDDKGNMYLLFHEDYSLRQLPIGTVDPHRERITLIGNMFNWGFRISDDTATRWRFIDTDTLEPLATYDFVYPVSTAETISRYIFPYRLEFRAGTDEFVYPRITGLSWHALALNLLLALIILAIMRRRGQQGIAEGTATLILGLFVFIPLILIKD